MTSPTCPSATLTLRLDALHLEPELQVRAHLDEKVVREYAERMRAGDHFPPILVFCDPETGEYRVVDGFHRVHAARAAQHGEIRAEVRPGTRREALLAAVGCNARHGLRRSNEDKRKAVQVLFVDPAWSEWSDGEIARKCGVSQPFVSRLRGEWRARQCAEQRAEFEAEAATHNGYELAEPPAGEQRRYRRGGREATMATDKIGKCRPSAPADEAPMEAPDASELGELARRIEQALLTASGEMPVIQPGTWWRLGGQHLFCGPADGRFTRYLPSAPLGLWRPDPAPARVAVEHCFEQRAAVVAVPLDDAQLLRLFTNTHMDYRRTLAVLPARAASSGDTWQPVALFGADAAIATIPAVLRVTGTPDAPVRLEAELTLQLIERLTGAGDPVIDPSLGDGVTLLAAAVMDRVCWGAEADPARCGRIIRAWEALTGDAAVPAPVLQGRAA